MPICFSPGCSHRATRDECKFYRFPAKKKDFAVWKRMCRRNDRDPTREDRLCSCHFIDGKKGTPTIFSWNKNKLMNFPMPEKNNRKKQHDDNGSRRTLFEHSYGRFLSVLPDFTTHGTLPVEDELEVNPRTSSLSLISGSEHLGADNIETTVHEATVLDLCTPGLPSVPDQPIATPETYFSDVPGNLLDMGMSSNHTPSVNHNPMSVPSSFHSNQTPCSSATVSFNHNQTPVPSPLSSCNSSQTPISSTFNSPIASVSNTETDHEITVQDKLIPEALSVLEGPSSTLKEEYSLLKSRAILSEAELYFKEKENEELRQRNLNRMSFARISERDKLVFQYTGLPTASHFRIVANLLKRFNLSYFLKWRVEALSIEDQLLMTLMKLRLNLRFFDLAFRFQVSDATVHNVVKTILYALHETLFLGVMDKLPSRDKCSYFPPQCLAVFPNCRCILDCTEIEVAIPQPLNLKKAMFSHYKQRYTFKVLLGIAPNGTVIYVSNLYPGSTSDKSIVTDSCILNMFQPGDMIIADKGFMISEMCRERGVSLNIPPFLTNPQFTEEEVLSTRRIARARIHVERAINRLKNFKILDFISESMREDSSAIVQTCAALVNLQFALLKESEQCFSA